MSLRMGKGKEHEWSLEFEHEWRKNEETWPQQKRTEKISLSTSTSSSSHIFFDMKIFREMSYINSWIYVFSQHFNTRCQRESKELLTLVLKKNSQWAWLSQRQILHHQNLQQKRIQKKIKAIHEMMTKCSWLD